MQSFATMFVLFVSLFSCLTSFVKGETKSLFGLPATSKQGFFTKENEKKGLWRIEGHVLYLKVNSPEKDPEEGWVSAICKKFRKEQPYLAVSLLAEDLIATEKFTETQKKGVTFEVAILHRHFFDAPNKPNNKLVRVEAKKRGWITPPPNIACLILNTLDSNDFKHLRRNLGYSKIIIMHEPISVKSHMFPTTVGMLSIDLEGGETMLLCEFNWFQGGLEKREWGDNVNFVFIIPQAAKKEKTDK